MALKTQRSRNPELRRLRSVGVIGAHHAQFAALANGSGRFVLVTDPTGRAEYIERVTVTDQAEMPANEPVPAGIDASRLNLHNTYHWTKQAYAQGLSRENARIIRWAEQADGGPMSVVASTKMPLTNRVWFTYPGLAWGYAGSSATASQTTQIQPDGTKMTTSTATNDLGMPVSVQDPQGRVTTYEYHPNGRDLFHVWHTAGGQTDLLTTLTGYVNGQPQTVIAANGTTTSFAYNARGQAASVANALGETTSIAYVEAGGPAFGRRNTVTADANALAATTGFGYDNAGRLSSVTDPSGDTVTFAYDSIGGNPLQTLDRVTTTTGPDGSGAWVLWDKLDVGEQHEFHPNAAGRVTTYTHDANRKVTNVLYPSGKSVSYVQGNCCGSVDTLVDAAGNQTHWEYDLLGRVAGKWLRWQQPDQVQVQAHWYDTVGRPQAVQDARGNVKYFAYDAEGRLGAIQYAVNDPNTKATPDVSFAYEPVYGRVATVLDGTGTTAYAYNPMNAGGSLGSETKFLPGGAQHYTHSYAYDALGRRTAGPRQDSAQWDALGRLTNVGNGLGAFSFAYEGKSGRVLHADAALTGATVAGLRTSFTYGTAAEQRRLTGIIHQVGYFVLGGTGGQVNVAYDTLSQHNYGYDTQGRLSSWQKWSAEAQSTWALTQDTDDQLTGVEENGNGAFAYGYDAAGNRTASTAAGVTREWTASGLNQITGETNGAAFTYDADGNLLSDGTRTYQWDAENRLVGISGPFGTVTWDYDAFSRRVKQHDTPPGEAVKVRDLIWEGLAIIESRDATGEVRRYYGNGEEREVPGSDVLPIHYMTDHLGSIRELVDGTGTIRARYDYGPYGERTKLSGDLDADFGFTGHYTHETSGIVLAPYRGYDPAAARWLSRDPIGEDGGLNLYGYVFNNPVIHVDPLGLDVFFNEENEIGGHAWVKIGGYSPTGGKTYGAYPNGELWGKPAVIQCPDPHINDDDFHSERIKTTPEDEAALENWIKNNYDINDFQSKRNPNYNLVGADCRSFRNKVKNQLVKIIVARGGRYKSSTNYVPKTK